MTNFLSLAVFLSAMVTAHAFLSSSSLSLSTKLSITANELSELTPAMEDARKEAFFWFFGASGGAGIARGAFPKMYQNTRFIQNLRGVGPTEGGETVGLSPLCNYPQDISKADLAKIVNNPKTVEEIVEENPYPDNFLAKKGYLIYDAFVDGNPDCNPLALRAVFDCFAQSTNVVDPSTAQQKIDSYKADPSGETFKNELLLSKAKGYAAIATLLFLLGLADVFAFKDVALGWFPDWPGIKNFPQGLWNPGVWTIPDYWV